MVGPQGMKIGCISRIATVQDKIDIVLDFWNVIQTHCLKNTQMTINETLLRIILSSGLRK